MIGSVEVQNPEATKDRMWSPAKLDSPNSLADVSTMQFSVLGFVPRALNQEKATASSGAAKTEERCGLGEETFKFLRSSDAARDDCFSFDFEEVVETCSDDL